VPVERRLSSATRGPYARLGKITITFVERRICVEDGMRQTFDQLDELVASLRG